MHVFEMRARVTEDAIRSLVHSFYAAIREDDVLGPIFASHIDDDDWPAHLQRMCDFWSNALLATGRYHGNPMVVHAAIDALRTDHFDRWLGLFEQSAADTFPAPVARSVVARAQRMGARLRQVAS